MLFPSKHVAVSVCPAMSTRISRGYKAFPEPERAPKRGLTWHRFVASQVTDLPRFLPTVYALYLGRALVYIGRTRDTRKRLQTHIRHQRHFDSFKVCVLDRPEHRSWLEQLLIARLRPSGNRFINRRGTR